MMNFQYVHSVAITVIYVTRIDNSWRQMRTAADTYIGG